VGDSLHPLESLYFYLKSKQTGFQKISAFRINFVFPVGISEFWAVFINMKQISSNYKKWCWNRG